jgi:uncharacterized surface protein with fasciclin (FAS1) repeats
MKSVGTRARVAVLNGLLMLAVAACGGSSASTVTTASSTSLVTVTVPAVSSAPSTSEQSTTSTSVKTPTKSILELAKAEGSLSTLLGLLDKAGLTATLEGSGPFSLVAPTDAAFAKMDKDTLDKISQNPTVLTSLLKYHLVAARITTQDVTAGFVTTMEGSTLALQATTKLPTVNGLKVTRGAKATNGTILVIESVLLPVDLKLP